MDYREELLALRGRIDRIDKKMLELFAERMGVSGKIAEVKSSGNIAIADEKREQQVLDAALSLADGDSKAETAAFMRTLMALSRLRQAKSLNLPDSASFPPPAGVKTEDVSVGFQGVAGAWGEHAAAQLFPNAGTRNFDYFEDVFEAVKSGEVDFGVLPIENSQTGAIGEVYGLLRRYGCYITGQVWITVAQCLLSGEGVSVGDIREVFSHPEGFKQCRRFLKNKNLELTACRNTAYAARMVAERNDGKSAAIGSRSAAAAYGLSVIAPDITDNEDNKTRFISISKNPVYDESSDTTSITFSTAHTSGALCAVLQSFMVAGINLSRIESRPVSADRYRFFADLQANVMSDITADALRQASMHCSYFEILGCYGTSVEATV